MRWKIIAYFLKFYLKSNKCLVHAGMPRVLNDEEKRVLVVVSGMLEIRDSRMAWEERRFKMANDMRDIRAKRLVRAVDIAAHERELRARRGNFIGPLSIGQKQAMKMFIDRLE